ncbi:N-acetylmuramoyl-L-alanine amidase [Paenibacillus agaridevorans]|uniref:N-acetylmuramoyl-L-alanine amidase n=1 Tax=Paenibacillus agaridevorans TaxID=171404 RepID=UPI001BE3CFEB|nr:N-acetylmuramoyl-L-alanine amidase [Paenibacillus agaridevorans]
MDINQTPVTSYSNRSGRIPLIIVNHISAGSMGSMYNTFKNPSNRASSHFGISRKGEIVQYVPIQQAAWTQGKIQSSETRPIAPIIRQHMGNPNLYGVSIEHEGYAGHGIQGDLTEEQFWATCWLHKFIQSEVERLYGHRIELNSHHVIGHFQIDAIGKPVCPGLLFPWANLYSELAYASTMSLEEYTEQIQYKTSQQSNKALAFAFVSRIKDLKIKLDSPIYGKEAERKILLMSPVMEELSYSAYFKEVTARGIAERIEQVYDNANTVRWEKEGIRKLIIGANYAKQMGLL